MQHWITYCLCTSLAYCSVGCGGSETVSVVPVYGKVTIGGDAPGKDGSVTFTVVEPAEGFPRRPATATFAADGSYEATSFEPGDGLVPGKYVAVIQCYDGTPTDDDPTSFDRLNVVPKTYRPEVNVDPAADSVEANFDVPPKTN